LHMAQLMPLPLTVSCFSKIQIGFTFLVPAHLGSPGKRAVKRVQCSINLFCSILSLFCAFSSAVSMYSRFIPMSKHLRSRQCLQNRRLVRSIRHCWSYRHLKCSYDTTNSTSCYSNGSQRPHRCCILMNKAAIIDHTLDIGYNL